MRAATRSPRAPSTTAVDEPARVGVLAALLESEGRITDATLLYEVQGVLTEQGR